MTTKGMNLPAPGDTTVVRATIEDENTAAKCATQQRAREEEAKVAAGV